MDYGPGPVYGVQPVYNNVPITSSVSLSLSSTITVQMAPSVTSTTSSVVTTSVFTTSSSSLVSSTTVTSTSQVSSTTISQMPTLTTTTILSASTPVSTAAGKQVKSGNTIAPVQGGMITSIIYGVLGILVVAVAITVVCLIRCCLIQRKRIRQNSVVTAKMDKFASDYSALSATQMHSNLSQLTNRTSATTWMASQTEFAVPAFLRYKAGLEFRWHTMIAKGGGGEVFLGDALLPRLAGFGQTIIVKIVGPSRETMNSQTAMAFDQEISVMHYLGRHKNIAGLLGWCDEPICMLMKYYGNGSLANVIHDRRVNNKAIKQMFMLDISRGLQFMHWKGVAHCDMKPANILVDQDKNGRYFCALTDFGILQMFTVNANLVRAFQVVNLRGASVTYAAPEVMLRFRLKQDATKDLAFAGDIYSFGIIMFELTTLGV